MKQEHLTRNQIIANAEKSIIENFHRISKQLGIISEGGKLVSNCCGVSAKSEFDERGELCSKCGKHCSYIMNENTNSRDYFSVYISRVIERLVELQSAYVAKADTSAQSIVDAVVDGKYDEFIASNMERGFTTDKTAMSIRDHWYGV